MQISLQDNLPFILIIVITLKGLVCARHYVLCTLSPLVFIKSPIQLVLAIFTNKETETQKDYCLGLLIYVEGP